MGTGGNRGHRGVIRLAKTMQPTGRALLFQSVLCFVLVNLSPIASSSDYKTPIEVHLWESGRSALSHMVDVTNGFGLKVLAEHNFLNENNIAFSPYGLTGIMVALYEGVEGESSYQLQHGIPLPWNRNIMRVGFRDIHRTLKTYFVPEEGFLAGLALNNENITFTEKYKTVLRYYGFDLDNDQLPTLPNVPLSTVTTPTTTPTASETTTSSTTAATTSPDSEAKPPTSISDMTSESVTSGNEETSNTNKEESTSTTERAPDPTTTAVTSTKNNDETSVTTNDSADGAADGDDSSAAVSSSVDQTTQLQGTTEESTVSQLNVDEAAATTKSNEAPLTMTTQAESVNSEQSLNSDVETITKSISSPESDSTVPPPSTSEGITENSEVTTTPTSSTTIETLERRKRSLIDFIFADPSDADDYLVYKSFEIPARAAAQDFNDDRMFMVNNGAKGVQVSYMQYDTILQHAYLPHLEASALRLPLDSERYYLLAVLPTRTGAAQLTRLLARMARESDLRDVYEALRPRRVRALVPNFSVKGHVTLTTDLQKLGIREVFEPRQRDFGPMTAQAQVYVRNIEQAVSVTIRKYQPDEIVLNRYITSMAPVYFHATYPFLYFVMDSNIHVALMAGKMVDPLNSRIL